MDPKSIIQKFSQKNKIAGISVGLINKTESNTFHVGEIKKASGIIPTEETLFEIGSMTKTFTAILAAQLQQEGILSLDEPITKYLPEFVNSEFDKKNITLFHLLTHTSGIIEFPYRVFIPQILSILIKGKSRIPQYSYNSQKFLDFVSKLKLKNSPGSTFSYSNSGVGLAGKIFERVTNSSYEELIQNRICDELDMKDTRINILETQKNRLATGYTPRNKEADYWVKPAIESAGSLYSTVSDMLKFLKANLGLKKSKLSEVMQYCYSTKIEPKIPFSMKFSTGIFGIGLSTFRLGWFGYPKDNKILVHSGGTEGFTSFMAINLEDQKGVVVLTNRGLRPVDKLGIELLKNLGHRK